MHLPCATRRSLQPRATPRRGSPLDGISALPPVLATESLRTSSGWTLTVLAWLGICWVATAHQARSGRAWLPATIGGIAVVTQCALAWFSPTGDISWPGPATPVDWAADGWALRLDDPAALAPAVVLLALAGTAWWSVPVRTPLPARGEPARRALLAVGVPALALWLGAVGVIASTPAFEHLAVPIAAVEPGGPLLLVVIAAALASRGGRIAALALVAAQVAVTAPLVSMWWGGSSDLLLLACALSAGATACAAAWNPAARALTDLAEDSRPVPPAPGSLPS